MIEFVKCTMYEYLLKKIAKKKRIETKYEFLYALNGFTHA